MDRRSFLGTTAVLALSVTAREARAQTLTPMTIAPLSGPSDAALYYAQQQGWFRQAGLDLTIQPTANGPAAMSALVGGSIHVSEGNMLSLAGAHAKGIPMTLIAPGSVFDASQTPSVRLVASTSSTVKSPKDLGGKTVAVPSLSDLLTISIRTLIDKSGGDSMAVHFVEMPPAAMGGALQAQRIDAAGMYEPFLSGALAQGARPIGVPYAALAPKFMIVAWFAYGPWAQAHRDAVAVFTGVITRAAAYANAHARELIPMISGFSHIPEDVLATMQIIQIAPTLDPALIQPIINAAAKYKVIPQAFPAKELIYS
jgi:NitT/TauT family transport system substrate-binding protein